METYEIINLLEIWYNKYDLIKSIRVFDEIIYISYIDSGIKKGVIDKWQYKNHLLTYLGVYTPED